MDLDQHRQAVRDVAFQGDGLPFRRRLEVADADACRRDGVARVYTPKDFDRNTIIREVADVVAETMQEAAE